MKQGAAAIWTMLLIFTASAPIHCQTAWRWYLDNTALQPGAPPRLDAEVWIAPLTGDDTLMLGHHSLRGFFSDALFDFEETSGPEMIVSDPEHLFSSLTSGPDTFDWQWNGVCRNSSGLPVPAAGRHIFTLQFYVRNSGGTSNIRFTDLQQTFDINGEPVQLAYDNGDGDISLDTTSLDVEGGWALPRRYELLPNYPNPFNPGTTIRYTVPRAGHTDLTIYNVRGRSIRKLFNGMRLPGSYSLYWDGSDSRGLPAAAGVYLLRFQSGTHQSSRKLLLMK